MASNYSYMNNNSGGTNYTQAQQGQQALAATRQNSSVMNDYQPSPGATISQGGGNGITAPPRQYATSTQPVTQYGPTYTGTMYGPSGGGQLSMNGVPAYNGMPGYNGPAPYQPNPGYNPYASAQQASQQMFPMTTPAGMTNSEDWFRNRDNATILQNWMSMLPYYQTGIEATQNARDFGEDVRRYNINTGWTQNMDLQNLGLANQDRQLNWAGLNENARQFNETQPLNWAAQGTNQYGAETQRLAANYNNQNTQFANQTERMGTLGDLRNQEFANLTSRMVGMGGVNNEATAIANNYAIDQEKNRIADLAARGVISNDQATQEFKRLELAAETGLGWAGIGNTQFANTTERMLGQQNLSLQDVINQRELAYKYAALAQQQAQANAQAYGRFATPNVSRTRRNF